MKEKLNLRNNDAFLIHYGTDGMKWYERRYQNPDGSLTDEGRKHYGVGPPRKSKEERRAELLEKRALKKERNEQKRLDAISKKKEKLYIDGDKDALYRNRKLFTTEEYQKALQRAELFDRSKPIKENSKQSVRDILKQNIQNQQPIQDPNKMKTGRLYIPEKKQSNVGLSDRRKNTIINSGDAKVIKANMKYLTDQELKQALERLKIDSELKGKSENTKAIEKALNDRDAAKNGKTVVKTLTTGLGDVSKLGTTAVDAYNTYNHVAAAVNIVSGKESLPVFKDVENKNPTVFNNFSKNLKDNYKTNTQNQTINVKQKTNNDPFVINTVGGQITSPQSFNQNWSMTSVSSFGPEYHTYDDPDDSFFTDDKYDMTWA